MAKTYPLRFLIALLMSFVLAGCMTTHKGYKGARRPPEEIAILRGTENDYFVIQIRNVDGKDFNPDNLFPNIVQLLPGEHVVKVGFYARGQHTHSTFRVNLQAGETYEVRFDADPKFGPDGFVTLNGLEIFAVGKAERVLSIHEWEPFQHTKVNIPIIISIGN